MSPCFSALWRVLGLLHPAVLIVSLLAHRKVELQFPGPEEGSSVADLLSLLPTAIPDVHSLGACQSLLVFKSL